MAARPAIIIPGIQGSMLQNHYPLDPATTWSTLTIAESKVVALDFQRLALDLDGRADFDSHVLSRPSQLIDIAYAKLAAGLQGRRDGSPAYLFAYDWRYSIKHTAFELVRFVDQLGLKKVARDCGGAFDFAVHSMGGLVFRQFLQAWRDVHGKDSAPPVNRVAFIATPHKGSLDAVEMLISGESPLLGGQKEMRKLARTFPAVYELMPLMGNGVMRIMKGGVELDPFDLSSWQDNTRSDFNDKDPNGYSVEQVHLNAARDVVSELPKLDGPLGLDPGNLLVVYGVTAKDATKVRINVSDDAQQWYDFDGAVNGPGDDIVPKGSALLDNVTAVEIQDTDLDYFLHPIQRAMISKDLHAFLPALDEVQTIVASFFEGLKEKDLLPVNLQREKPSRVTIDGAPQF